MSETPARARNELRRQARAAVRAIEAAEKEAERLTATANGYIEDGSLTRDEVSGIVGELVPIP